MSISSSATGLKPGVCTSTTRPTNPYTGQIIYETDTGYLRVWDGANWDYFSPKQDTIPGEWISWTPTVSQSSNVTFTTVYAKYTRFGKTIVAQAHLSVTGTGSAGTGITVSAPVQMVVSNGPVLGSGFFYDASTNNIYNLTTIASTATNIGFFSDLTGASSLFGTSPSIGAAASDQIRFTAMYEAA